jgi:hypothetical protein
MNGDAAVAPASATVLREVCRSTGTTAYVCDPKRARRSQARRAGACSLLVVYPVSFVCFRQ